MLTTSSGSTQVISRYADRLLGCRHLPSHRRMPEVGGAPCDTGCDIRLPLSQTPSAHPRRLNRLHMLEPTRDSPRALAVRGTDKSPLRRLADTRRRRRRIHLRSACWRQSRCGRHGCFTDRSWVVSTSNDYCYSSYAVTPQGTLRQRGDDSPQLRVGFRGCDLQLSEQREQQGFRSEKIGTRCGAEKRRRFKVIFFHVTSRSSCNPSDFLTG